MTVPPRHVPDDRSTTLRSPDMPFLTVTLIDEEPTPRRRELATKRPAEVVSVATRRPASGDPRTGRVLFGILLLFLAAGFTGFVLSLLSQA